MVFPGGNSNCGGNFRDGANTNTRSITVTVADDAANSPQVLTINGTATAAASIASANGQTTTASVTAGQTAQYNLTATPGTGFNGTLASTCSGVPFGATWTVSLQSIAVANGAAANFSVSIATGSSGALVLGPLSTSISPRTTHRVPLIPLLPLVAFLRLLACHSFEQASAAKSEAAANGLVVHADSCVDHIRYWLQQRKQLRGSIGKYHTIDSGSIHSRDHTKRRHVHDRLSNCSSH
ncbi:MAG TPA: hypothetical protein VGH37_18135 [Candidatus Acidoferrum sp.]